MSVYDRLSPTERDHVAAAYGADLEVRAKLRWFLSTLVVVVAGIAAYAASTAPTRETAVDALSFALALAGVPIAIFAVVAFVQSRALQLPYVCVGIGLGTGEARALRRELARRAELDDVRRGAAAGARDEAMEAARVVTAFARRASPD